MLPRRFEEEQHELEKRKRRALEEYRQKKKLSSSSSSLDNSGPLSTSRKSSTDPHDVPQTQSPSQSRRGPVVDLEIYQEAGKIGTVSLSSSSSQELPSLPPLKRDPAADMEKKVRDELMAEFDQSTHNQQEPESMALSTRNFSSPPGVRSPRHLTSVQDLHAKTSHVLGSSKAYHSQHQQPAHSHVRHHHRGGAEGSPLSPPPPVPLPSQSPVPRSPTLPTATFMLPTSPPPPVSQQSAVWTSRSQPHHMQPHHHHGNMQHQFQHNVTGMAGTTISQSIRHSDSGEWTEFTSAPYGVDGRDPVLTLPSVDGFPASHSTPALGTLTNSGSGGLLAGHTHHHQQGQGSQQKAETYVSEFDPIAVSTLGDGVPGELHQAQPPFKHRT